MTALNFPDSPSNGATYQGYTYNSTKGTWTKPDDPDARTAVYANIAALPTSGTAGDMAYVTATNRLYIWTGTGWYNIALINNNPTISGVSAAYNLAIDGTATTVTITATDPEGLPITYSIASDTSGNIATVAQGTGANTNVFTITPSTNTAHAGTFSLTFRASDGVNIASAAASFTLQFSVQNQHYTTALITSVGANNATNASFDDKSTNDHTITVSGDAHQTTFSPYRHGGYSTYFDGSGDYLTIADDASLDFGTGDFTVECWFNLPTNSSNNPIIFGSGWYFQTKTNDSILSFYTGSTEYTYSIGSSLDTNTWHHIAAARSGSTLKVFLNGTEVKSVGNSDNIQTTGSGVLIGRLSGQTSFDFKGYITDVRIVKGTAVYTSAFTPPTERLTAITNTSLLACHLPYIADGSTNGHTITINGNTSTKPFAPYDAQEYSAADHGGSVRFDGSSDYIQAPAASVARGTGDYTIETWVYYYSLPNTYNQIWDTRTGATPTDDFLQIQSNGGLRWRNNGIGTTAAGTIKVNQWHHVAQCRSSGTVKTYVDGVEKASNTNTASLSHGAVISIGGAPLDNGSWSNANFADFRVVLGTAVYTSAFTPPTAPLTAITNTSLLLQSTDAGIIDKSQSVQTLTLNGDVKSSTTQSKYLTSSMYFDGNGDYITLSNSTDRLGWLANLSAVGTIEAWVYSTTLRSGGQAYQHPSILALGNTYFTLNVNSSGQVTFYWYNGSINSITSTAAISVNTWHHVAAVVTATSGSNNVTLYVDGTSVGTGTYGGLAGQAATALGHPTFIGYGNSSDGAAYWPGYISDLRITEGLARYTSNFTAPTAALQG